MNNVAFELKNLSAFEGHAHKGKELYVPEKVCAKAIRFSVEDGKLTNVSFTGGCDGNLKAISALVDGMPVEQVISTLSGITCGRKDTSCADQLCNALRDYMKD